MRSFIGRYALINPLSAAQYGGAITQGADLLKLVAAFAALMRLFKARPGLASVAVASYAAYFIKYVDPVYQQSWHMNGNRNRNVLLQSSL